MPSASFVPEAVCLFPEPVEGPARSRPSLSQGRWSRRARNVGLRDSAAWRSGSRSRSDSAGRGSTRRSRTKPAARSSPTTTSIDIRWYRIEWFTVPQRQVDPFGREVRVLEVLPVRRRMGGGQDEPAARPEHPEHFAEELRPVRQVVQDQGAQHAVEGPVHDPGQTAVQVMPPDLGPVTEPGPGVFDQHFTVLESQNGRPALDQGGHVEAGATARVEDPLPGDVSGQFQHRRPVDVSVVDAVLGVGVELVSERAVVSEVRGHAQQYRARRFRSAPEAG